VLLITNKCFEQTIIKINLIKKWKRKKVTKKEKKNGMGYRPYSF